MYFSPFLVAHDIIPFLLTKIFEILLSPDLAGSSAGKGRGLQFNFHNAYYSSPGRPDITGWSDAYKATQITTEQQMAAIDFPVSEVIGQRRRDWTRRWQEIMGG